jgi:hypothetical protein
MSGFAHGLGQWLGCAEVFSGEGRFLGNALDQRRVQDLGEGRTRIDLAFVGPVKAAGHYVIESHPDRRIYHGPVNIGYAETWGASTVDANAYWPDMGLSQRFVLMVIPEKRLQLTLALMSRGEQLLYVIVGENQRIDPDAGDTPPLPNLIGGAEHDLRDDPCAGRGCVLLHRPGVWHGPVTTFDAQRQPVAESALTETVQTDAGVIHSTFEGLAQVAGAQVVTQRSNGWQAWTATGDVVGSDNLSGGRARCGNLIFRNAQLRLYRREVISSDGTQKAIVHVWYRGGERIGAQTGLLRFQS